MSARLSLVLDGCCCGGSLLGFGRRWTRLRSDLLIEPFGALVVILLVDHGVARLQINVEKPSVHILTSVQDRQLLGLFR